MKLWEYIQTAIMLAFGLLFCFAMTLEIITNLRKFLKGR